MAKWGGWWERRGCGRQEMHNLLLEVDADGMVKGHGEDCVGRFTFRGQFWPDGTVSLVKQYLYRHAVFYEGCNFGEEIVGRWFIRGLRAAYETGRFVLRPVTVGFADCVPIEEMVPVCEAVAR